MMGSDHPSCIPVGPLVGELRHFEYFPTWRPSAILNSEILMFDHVTVIAVLNCCCIPNFIKICSRVRPPDAHNCWMYNAPLLSNGHCHGNRIMGNMDATTQVSSKSLHWYASYSVSNILQYGGRPPSWIRILLFLTTHEVNNAVQLPCQNLVSIRNSPPEILRFYNFASLAGKCLTTPPFWRVLAGLNPLKLWVVIQTPKWHILGWRRVI